MESFAERKQHALWRMESLDRSKKGSVDRSVKPLLEAINAHEEYYTTSSCGGRILLLHEPDGARKNEYAWPLVTHEGADLAEFREALKKLEGSEGRVWLRMQTVIVHVACKDLSAAERLLDAFHCHGWKRSGIFSLANDVMVELLSVEHMDAPVMRDGELLVSDAFIEEFITLANEKLAVAHEKISTGAARVQGLGHAKALNTNASRMA